MKFSLKIITLTILCLTFTSCNYKAKREAEIKKYLDEQNFTVVTPSNWRAVRDHGHVSYTPINKGGEIMHCLVRVVNYKNDENKTFKKFALDQINYIRNNRSLSYESVNKQNNKYGEVYIHEYNFDWVSKDYSIFTMYFQIDKHYYKYEYHTQTRLYDTYLNGANSILNSIKLK
ncbi:MAG: hypothetical protein ACPGU9_06040 [Flavobacteriaceae bacterium]